MEAGRRNQDPEQSWFSGGNDGESKTGAKEGEIRTCGTDVEAEGEAEDEVLIYSNQPTNQRS